MLCEKLFILKLSLGSHIIKMQGELYKGSKLGK